MSQDIISVATLAASFFLLMAMAKSIAADLGSLLEQAIRACGDMQEAGRVLPYELESLEHVSVMALLKTLVIPLATVVCAIAATFAQTKMLVSGELLRPKFNRMSPIQGFKRLFSLKSIVDALKGILKITLLMVVIYMSLEAMLGESVGYLYTDIPTAAEHVFQVGTSMGLRVLMVFGILAAFDYLYQWWDFERQMRMSKQEIKEEYKQVEGDPQVKGKIKENQRRMAQQRMMQSVPQADVVIRNPTHFAVALRYHPDTDSAPVVLAKGQDELALRIVKVAEEHQVAVIENVPLARGLYAAVDLGQEIPPEFYGPVAEILIHIIKLDKQMR